MTTEPTTTTRRQVAALVSGAVARLEDVDATYVPSDDPNGPACVYVTIAGQRFALPVHPGHDLEDGSSSVVFLAAVLPLLAVVTYALATLAGSLGVVA